MTRRRILPRLLAVGVLVLALAGCVRFQADLTLSPENTVDGSIVVAVALQDDSEDSRDAALTAAQQIEDELLGSLRDASGVTTSEYEEDDYLGSLIELDDVSLDAFSGQTEDSLKIVRDGDEYVFTGALDFSGESVPTESDDEAADDNLTISVTFPGAVSEHNGELNGTTVSWSTTVDQRLDMSARGAATPPGPPVLLIVGIVLAVLLALAAIVALLLLLRSRKAKAGGTASTTEAPVVTPPAPAAEAAADAAATTPAATPAADAAPAAEVAPKKPRAPRTPKAPPAPEA
jgi:hypothetical protein